jgi:hypothetical protein
MEITKIDINLDFFIIAVITIIILLFSFPYFCQKAEQQKRNNIFEYIATFILLAAFIAPIYLYNYYTKYKKTNKYTIHYNQGTLKQTMTTQEIIDLVKNKSIFDEKKEYTSTVTINVPNGEKSNSFDNYIEWIRENTNTQRINQYEQEREQKLNEKYLNETHTVNIKN